MGVQYEHKYQIGEKVKVVKTPTVKHWNAAMDKYDGMVATVVGYFEECYKLDVDNKTWYWWPDMLQDAPKSKYTDAIEAVKRIEEALSQSDKALSKAFCEGHMCVNCAICARNKDDRGNTCPMIIMRNLCNKMMKAASEGERDDLLEAAREEFEKPKELSVAEIEKLLGYPVKVVKGE